MGKQEQNQKEGEFFALVATGRRGVEDMLAKMGDEIRQVASPAAGRDFDTWTKRAFLEIVNREELAPVLQTRQGIFSLYKCLVKAATMGVQIGGQYAHAYFVPFKGQAELVVTKDGMAHVAAYGPGAVLEYSPTLVRVYERDDFALDQASGRVVRHVFDPRADRGKLTGWYMVLKYRDGHAEAPFVTVAKVQQIVDAYSRTKDSEGRPMKAWAKSGDEMLDKTAAKYLLRPAARLAEGLAMALSAEDGDDPAPDPQPMRDVTERTVARLERAAETVGPGMEAAATNASPAQDNGGKVETAQHATNSAKQPEDLF